MKLGKATWIKRTPVLLEGTLNYVLEEFEVRVVAIAEGYAMVRRKGAMPFMCSIKDLKQ